MIDFDALLANSQTVSVEDVKKQVEENSQANSGFVNPYWSPKTDPAGNALAEVRILPAIPGENTPIVQYYEHFFRGPTGKVYAERSLTSLGQKDPVGELNSKLWNSGFEANKDIARKQARKLRYVVNVLVLNDKFAPENNLKIVQYRFGKQVFEKINAAFSDEFGDSLNPFDLLDGGANFRIVQTQKGDFPDFTKSHFGPKGPLFDGDRARMKSVFEGQEIKSLQAIVAPDQYKTYDELKARLNEVLEENDDKPVTQSATDVVRQTSKPVETKTETKTETKVVDSPASDSVEDSLAYFRSLASK